MEPDFNFITEALEEIKEEPLVPEVVTKTPLDKMTPRKFGQTILEVFGLLGGTRWLLASQVLLRPFVTYQKGGKDFRTYNEYPSNMKLIYIPGKIKVKVFLAWYDFWVGFYYDREFKELYICPIPCVVFKFYRVTKVVENEYIPRTR